MAPVISKRNAAEAKTSKLQRPPSTIESFPTTKEDKRRMKHSSFVSRIQKSVPSKHKRRRPSKKLVTTLESLADALPETQGPGDADVEVGNARIKHKSLKSRPGAMKKKAMLEAAEKDRFQKNLVQMTAGPNEGMGTMDGQAGGSSGRWAALRGFIGATMDKMPAKRVH